MATVTSFPPSIAIPSRDNQSYADILRFGSAIPNTKPKIRRESASRYYQTASSNSRCFRSGGGGHLAKVCREPVRCFSCGQNGHKRAKCPKVKPFLSESFKLSLAQAWSSMILQDDSFLRQADYGRKEMNDEQHLFTLDYLKLRKELIFGDGSELVRSVRLLDGLFNSNYKACSIASMLLDESSVTLDLDRQKRIDVQNTGFECPFFESRESEVFTSDDAILLDPWVGACRKPLDLAYNTATYTSALSSDLEPWMGDSTFNQSLGDSTLISEFFASPDLYSTDANGRVDLKLSSKSRFNNENVHKFATYSCRLTTPLRPITTTLWGVDSKNSDDLTMSPSGELAASNGGVTLGPQWQLSNNSETDRHKNTNLVLYNSFELLDCCLEDENFGENSEHYLNGPVADPCVHCSTCDVNNRRDFVGNVEKGEELYSNITSSNYMRIVDKRKRHLPASVKVLSSLDDPVPAELGLLDTCYEGAGNAGLESLRLMRETGSATLVVSECNVTLKQETLKEDPGCARTDAANTACCDNDSNVLKTKDSLLKGSTDLEYSGPVIPTLLNALTSDSDYSSTHVIGGGTKTPMVTPPSGVRRGRKRKGSYDYRTVRRSARLVRPSEITIFSDGCLPESGADGASDSGAGMISYLGSTYSLCALNNLSTSDMLVLARNSGFTFDDIQLDTDHIRARELERVNSLSS